MATPAQSLLTPAAGSPFSHSGQNRTSRELFKYSKSARSQALLFKETSFKKLHSSFQNFKVSVDNTQEVSQSSRVTASTCLSI